MATPDHADLAALASMPVTAGGERFDRDNVSQTDDLDILGQRVMRPGAENVEGKLCDKAQTGIANVHRPAVREADPQRDEGVTVQFIGQGAGGHAGILALRRNESQDGAAPSLSAAFSLASMPVTVHGDNGGDAA